MGKRDHGNRLQKAEEGKCPGEPPQKEKFGRVPSKGLTGRQEHRQKDEGSEQKPHKGNLNSPKRCGHELYENIAEGEKKCRQDHQHKAAR